MDGEPALRIALVGTDLPADVRGEDFGAAAGKGIDTRHPEGPQAVFHGDSVEAAHIIDFDGRVRLDGNRPFFRAVLPGEGRDHIDDTEIVVEILFRMDTSHDVDLGHPGLELGFAVGEDIFERHAPGPGLRGVVPPVGAEAAAVGADVRGLEMEVAVVVDAVAAEAMAHKRRRRLQFGQGRLIKFQQLFPGKSYQRSSELTVSFLRP